MALVIPAPPRPAKGRPASLSREAILDAAEALLERPDSGVPSLSAVARALKVAPMTLYTYFGDKNDLMQALSARVIGGFALPDADRGTPAERLTRWAHAMRDYILARPAVIDLLIWEGGHSSAGFLERARPVSEALAAWGLSGDALARATLWSWHIIMGAINAELLARRAPQEMSPADLDLLAAPTRAMVEAQLAVIRRPDHHAEFYQYQLDRLTDAIDALCKRSDTQAASDGMEGRP